MGFCRDGFKRVELPYAGCWGPIQEKDGLKYSDFTNVANIETLAKKEAGFYTKDNGTKMTVSVRKYGKTAPGSDIESVEILSQKTETYDFAGWHVMSLDKAVRACLASRNKWLFIGVYEKSNNLRFLLITTTISIDFQKDTEQALKFLEKISA